MYEIVNTRFSGTFVMVIDPACTVGHRALLTFPLSENINVLSDCKETVPEHEENLKCLHSYCNHVTESEMKKKCRQNRMPPPLLSLARMPVNIYQIKYGFFCIRCVTSNKWLKITMLTTLPNIRCGLSEFVNTISLSDATTEYWPRPPAC